MLRNAPVRLQRSFSQMTTNGVYGDPLSASAIKGQKILQAVLEALTPVIIDLYHL